MSAILLNSGTTKMGKTTTIHPSHSAIQVVQTKGDVKKTISETPQEEEKNEEEEEAREERKATGRSVAIVIFLSLMCLALYHVVQRKTTILAGILVPALILFTYTFFVIHVSSREKKRRKLLETANDVEGSEQSEPKKQELHKKISTVSNPSMISSSSIPSTSGASFTSTRNTSKTSMPKSISQVRIDPKTSKVFFETKPVSSVEVKKVPPPFKKAQSQSHISTQNYQSAKVSVEHEKKKLKKSRSFDKRQ